MLHIDIAFVGKEPGHVAQYFLNHRLKLLPKRLNPLPTFLMEEISGLILCYDQLFITVELFDYLFLDGDGWKRDFDGGNIVEANTFDDAANGEFPDFLDISVTFEAVKKILTR